LDGTEHFDRRREQEMEALEALIALLEAAIDFDLGALARARIVPRFRLELRVDAARCLLEIHVGPFGAGEVDRTATLALARAIREVAIEIGEQRIRIEPPRVQRSRPELEREADVQAEGQRHPIRQEELMLRIVGIENAGSAAR